MRCNEPVQYAFKVEVVVVFGSYPSEIPRIGDVNVAVRLKKRGRSKEQQERLEDASHDRASTHLATIFDRVVWPRREVMAALKARQPSIDLRELNELKALFRKGTAIRYEVLLGYWIPPSADGESGR